MPDDAERDGVLVPDTYIHSLVYMPNLLNLSYLDGNFRRFSDEFVATTNVKGNILAGPALFVSNGQGYRQLDSPKNIGQPKISRPLIFHHRLVYMTDGGNETVVILVSSNPTCIITSPQFFHSACIGYRFYAIREPRLRVGVNIFVQCLRVRQTHACGESRASEHIV